MGCRQPCRANVAHTRQSRPESGLGVQVKVLKPFKLLPLLSEAPPASLNAHRGTSLIRKRPFLGSDPGMSREGPCMGPSLSLCSFPHGSCAERGSACVKSLRSSYMGLYPGACAKPPLVASSERECPSIHPLHIRNCLPLRPYSRPIPRALRWSRTNRCAFALSLCSLSPALLSLLLCSLSLALLSFSFALLSLLSLYLCSLSLSHTHSVSLSRSALSFHRFVYGARFPLLPGARCREA